MLHKLEDHQPAAVPSLQDALALARRGLHVFPITPGEKAPPLIKQWQKFATTDPDQIRSWWSQWPDANIGAVREKLHEPLGPKCGDVKFHHMAVEERRKQRAVKIIAAKARKFEKQQQKEAQAFLDRFPGQNGIPQPVPDTPEGLGMKDHTSERNGPGFS